MMFRSAKDWPRYSLLEAKIGALEDFTKNASWQASFDYTIQIHADETQQSLS